MLAIHDYSIMYGLLAKLVRSRWLDISQILCLCVYGLRQSYVVLIIYRKRTPFSSGTQQVILSRQDNTILPAWVANHSAGFGLSCLLAQLAIYTVHVQL